MNSNTITQCVSYFYLEDNVLVKNDMTLEGQKHGAGKAVCWEESDIQDQLTCAPLVKPQKLVGIKARSDS